MFSSLLHVSLKNDFISMDILVIDSKRKKEKERRFIAFVNFVVITLIIQSLL